MALKHTILFTVMPRGISVNATPLPVSVFVSPRLEGADNLGAFSDWVQWTRHLADSGLTVQLRCGSQTHHASIDRQPLRPDLWEQLFKEDTLVRSHAFDDYSGHGIISYPVRQALSALKAIYQQASVSLALPDGAAGGRPTDEGGNRRVLRDLLDGLDVNWNGREAPGWRAAVRLTKDSARRAAAQESLSGPLDGEGLIVAKPDPKALQKVAVPFAVFHHMPTPPRDDLSLDAEKVLDFHQALTALSSYPELLRALGLVFDLHLPGAFVPETPLDFFSKEIPVFSLSFKKDDQGNITQAVAFRNDVWNKTRRPEISASNLKSYEGKYQSKDDPDNMVQLISRHNLIVIKQLWDGKEVEVTPLTASYFYNDPQSFPLQILRDKDGAVSQIIILGMDYFDKVR